MLQKAWSLCQGLCKLCGCTSLPKFPAVNGRCWTVDPVLLAHGLLTLGCVFLQHNGMKLRERKEHDVLCSPFLPLKVMSFPCCAKSGILVTYIQALST